jgi:hypothetical protein
MKNWHAKETSLTDRRNKLVQGYHPHAAISQCAEEQAANNRRYNGLMKNRRLTVASFK